MKDNRHTNKGSVGSNPPIHVLNINDKVSISGGVEVYLSLLEEYGPQFGIEFSWVSIFRKDDSSDFLVQEFKSENERYFSAQGLKTYIQLLVDQKEIDIINLHSISDPNLVRSLLRIKPMVRHMHEPRMFCPGQGKFWRHSEKACTKPFGLHCFVHTYTQGCCNRHPKRVLAAWKNTNFEIANSKENYARIIVMSDYMKDESIAVGYDKESIDVNPYFTPIKSKTVAIEEKFKSKKLTFIGRLIEHKGPQRLIAYLADTLRVNGDITLDIVGDGPIKGQLEAEVNRLGLTKQIRFLGWLSNKESLRKLEATSLFLFSSLYPEAFGIVGIEAMMHHTPVVGFNVGGASTWLYDGETGFLTDPDDKQAFCNSITEILGDYDRYVLMANRSFELATTKFSPEVHMKKLKSTYSKVMDA